MKLSIEARPEEIVAFVLDIRGEHGKKLLDELFMQAGDLDSKPSHDCLPCSTEAVGKGFATQVKSLRQKQQLTAKQVGDAIGVDRCTISQYETGRREPNIDKLLKLSKLFNVSMDVLLGT